MNNQSRPRRSLLGKLLRVIRGDKYMVSAYPTAPGGEGSTLAGPDLAVIGENPVGAVTAPQGAAVAGTPQASTIKEG